MFLEALFGILNDPKAELLEEAIVNWPFSIIKAAKAAGECKLLVL